MDVARIPKQRIWRCRRDDELCTYEAPCAACRGARNRRAGLRKQREARKALEAVTGAQAGRYASQTGNEENWRLAMRVEVKSGAQVGPAWTRYLAAETQAEAARAHGDFRPFVAVLMARDSSDGLVVFRLSALNAIKEALT